MCNYFVVNARASRTCQTQQGDAVRFLDERVRIAVIIAHAARKRKALCVTHTLGSTSAKAQHCRVDLPSLLRHLALLVVQTLVDFT